MASYRSILAMALVSFVMLGLLSHGRAAEISGLAVNNLEESKSNNLVRVRRDSGGNCNRECKAKRRKGGYCKAVGITAGYSFVCANWFTICQCY